MKVSELPTEATADGSEEVVIIRGPADARETRRMAAALLAQAATRPTPDELKAAILGALVAGQNITFTQNADGTVGVAVSDSADLPGTPKAPTAAPGTNTRQIATTAFVDAVRAALTTAIGGKQATLVAGANIDLHANGDGTFTIASTAAGGGALTDGVYGDVTVSGGGTVLTVTKVTNGTVTVPDEAYGAAWQTKLSVPTKNAVYNQIEAVKSSKVSTTAVGVANGVASLDATGKVPAGQLPSYVDDVLEFSNSGAFPNPGETGKIYVAMDTNAQWRWSGTAYVQLIASPGTTDNVVEGSTNKYYTDVRVRAAVMTGLVSTAGTPVGTDSLLTVLGKLYRQAFTQVLPLAGGVMTGNIVAANGVRIGVTDTGGTSPNIVCQGDNNVVFYSTDASGALRPIWSTFARSSTATFGFAVGVTFANGLSVDAGVLNANGSDGTYGVGVKQTRTGQVGYHMYNGGAVAEWLTYQPAHASGDDYRIATYVGGVTTDRFKIGADGTTYAMSTLYAGGEFWVNGKVIRFGGAGSAQFIYYDGFKFQINGPVNTNGFDVSGGCFYSSGANGGFTMNDRDGSADTTTAYYYADVFKLYFGVTGGDKFTVDSSGNVWCAGNFSAASDARLKSDIRALEGDGAAVLALEPKRYTKDGREQIGFIAQEVESVLPEAVTTAADEMETKGLDLYPIVAELVARVKFLDAEVARLKAAA